MHDSEKNARKWENTSIEKMNHHVVRKYEKGRRATVSQMSRVCVVDYRIVMTQSFTPRHPVPFANSLERGRVVYLFWSLLRSITTHSHLPSFCIIVGVALTYILFMSAMIVVLSRTWNPLSPGSSSFTNPIKLSCAFEIPADRNPRFRPDHFCFLRFENRNRKIKKRPRFCWALSCRKNYIR